MEFDEWFENRFIVSLKDATEQEMLWGVEGIKNAYYDAQNATKCELSDLVRGIVRVYKAAGFCPPKCITSVDALNMVEEMFEHLCEFTKKDYDPPQ